MRQPSSPAVLALALLFLADPRTAGAALSDPTRPLAGGGREEAAAPKPVEAAAVAVAAPDSSAPATPPALQSLQVPQQGEATAIVDGQLLKVGAKLGSYEVTHIDAHGLTVRGPVGRERWTLAGVEVLDSRQSAASLKMGPLGDVRKPVRRSSTEVSPPELTPRVPSATAPSPLVFPLPSPQGQPAPLPRPAPTLEQPPQSAPVTPGSGRPAVKQALSDGGVWPTQAALMTVGYQPQFLPSVQRAAVPVYKPGVSARKTWTATSPSKALRMDLDDMRRIVHLSSQSASLTVAGAANQSWQRRLGPNPNAAWVAAWGPVQATAQRKAMSQSETHLTLAAWRLPPQHLKAGAARAISACYSPVQGPRPMPASLVWRQVAPRQTWQPQGVDDLPGTRSSQWASTAVPVLQIAALERPVTPQHRFAVAKRQPAAWATGSVRWAQARKVPAASPAAPVTHTHPMAMPQWRNTPTAQADNSSLTQVAYALETP